MGDHKEKDKEAVRDTHTQRARYRERKKDTMTSDKHTESKIHKHTQEEWEKRERMKDRQRYRDRHRDTERESEKKPEKDTRK